MLNPVVTFSWRGAVIETDQATGGKYDGKNDDSTATRNTNSSRESGICCLISFGQRPFTKFKKCIIFLVFKCHHETYCPLWSIM